MAYTIAGIDVHKRMLAVVVSDLAADGEGAFERRQFGSTPAQLRLLADWLSECQVDEVVIIDGSVLEVLPRVQHGRAAVAGIAGHRSSAVPGARWHWHAAVGRRLAMRSGACSTASNVGARLSRPSMRPNKWKDEAKHDAAS
jgi:hypothetical protein